MTTRYLLGTLGGGSAYDAIRPEDNDTDEHAAYAERIAERTMVLLKNDGVLPLDLRKLQSVAVIGPNADSVACLEGNYNGISSRFVTFLAGIRAACKDRARVFYAKGSHLFKDRMQGLSGYAGDGVAEAVAAAKMADVSILCLGLDATLEGEEGDTGNEYSSGDKTTLELPPCQQRLLDAVVAVGKPVVVLLASGSALAVTQGNAILQTWYPGQAGGTAAARLLFGEASPSGRLPVTFYRDVAELPPFEDYAMANRTYRYFTGTPLYPFGYGLSYTRFTYADARYEDGAVVVSVRNDGDYAADEVAQVYIRPQDDAFAPLHPSLCAMSRLHLLPGEEASLRLPIPERAFTTVDDAGVRAKRAAAFTLYVGGNQPDARTAELTGTKAIEITVRG